MLSDLSTDFSGAEIEQVVIESMRLGFNQKREFTTEDIIYSIQSLVPLAKTKSKELKILQSHTLTIFFSKNLFDRYIIG